MELIERETFYICGYAVVTTAEQNDKDVSALYQDFFDTNKETILSCLQGSQNGYYTDIPKEGYAPNEPYNFYFEFYPEDVKGDYELWVPVVKSHQ